MTDRRKTMAQLASELEATSGMAPRLEGPANSDSIGENETSARESREFTAAHQLLLAVVDQSPMPMAIAMPDGRLWHFNRACAEHLGIVHDPSVRPGSNLFKLRRSWKIFDREGNQVADEELPLPLTLKGRTTRDRVLRVVRADGTERWASAHAAPLTNDDGELVAGFLAMPDITERMRAEERIRESEATTRAMLEAMPDLMFRLSRDGTHMDFFAPEGELFVPPRDIVGKTVSQILPGRVADQYLECISRTFAEGQLQIFEYDLEFAGGDLRIFEARMVPCDGYSVLVLVRNITERRRAEEAARESGYLLVESQRVARLGSYSLDVAAGTWSSSPILDEIFGIGNGYRRDVEGWLQIVHPDERSAMRDYLATAVLVNHERFDREYRIMRISDESVRWVHGLGEMKFDPSGNPVQMIGTIQDITERRALETEKAALETQLRHSQKLETVGTLAGGIAHDFNNLLTPIMGFAEILQSRAASDDDHADLDRILMAAHRAKELVERILLFSQQVEKDRKLVRVQSIAEEAIQLLRPSIPSTISINQSIDPDCPPVMADDTQIHQVVVNLCTNAFQAMEKTGGTLSVEVERVEIDSTTARLRPNLTESEYVCLSVRDTGPGIDKEMLGRVFEPFFTTKSVKRGTGLGLSVVHGIVSGHQGDLLVESAPGEGAVFRVYLPTARAEVEATQEVPRERRGEGESVLVVDDDPAVAQVVSVMLQRLGYLATVVSSGAEALDELRNPERHYDLVLSDLTMPQMTGLDLAERIREFSAGTPILIMTGYGEKLDPTGGRGGAAKVIAKPITMVALATAVRDAFGK